jgi:hypothetical protein
LAVIGALLQAEAAELIRNAIGIAVSMHGGAAEKCEHAYRNDARTSGIHHRRHYSGSTGYVLTEVSSEDVARLVVWMFGIHPLAPAFDRVNPAESRG